MTKDRFRRNSGGGVAFAYKGAQQYGGTALLWTFFVVLFLSISVVASAYNWRSIVRATEYWAPGLISESTEAPSTLVWSAAG